jgi:hypothetical protein
MWDAPGMVVHIWQNTKRPSPRKSQLFACAAARWAWDLMPEDRLRQAVETGELFAEALVPLPVARVAAQWCLEYCRGEGTPAKYAAALAGIAAWPLDDRIGDYKVAFNFCPLVPANADLLVAWVRDIFGNPFRPAAVDADWLAGPGGTAARLARGIYDEGRFADLPVLADALEEAGCDDETVLAHCHGGGPHVRGCWVLDLLLGKK